MIKLLAALFMLIDHVGLLLFPQIEALRIVGRLSMPLFAYSLARGYDHSRMKYGLPRYFSRLIVFAIVSQLPYRYLARDWQTLNIGATWLAGLALLVLIDRKRWKGKDFSGHYAAVGGFAAGVVLVVGVCIGVVHVDYGLYGIMLPAIFYLTIVRRHNYFNAFSAMTALWGVYTVLYHGNIGNAFGVLALPVIAAIEHSGKDSMVHLPKLTYYVFYPLHIAILLLIKNLMF